MKITTVGLDLAKNVFQVHGIDAVGEVVVRKTLRRRQMIPFFSKLEPCLIGMEACGTSHHWARELSGLGHQVKLMPPAYVKPYVKRGKTDVADAEAICEAVTRPTMRFVTDLPPRLVPIVILDHARPLASADLPGAPRTRSADRRGVAVWFEAPAACIRARCAA